MTVVVFHRVTDDIPLDGLTVRVDWFRDFCKLMQTRFNVITLTKLHQILQAGETPPRRTVAITFDDSYRDNLFAARLLNAHGLPATFFVPTQSIGTEHTYFWDAELPKMANLTWDDLKEMQSLGHEIGSHTVTHADLGALTPDDARQELSESKRVLEGNLGQPVQFFAYPFGARHNCPAEYLPMIRELGYEAAFSCHGGVVTSHFRGQILPRLAMPYFRSLTHLELQLAGCLDWFHHAKRRIGMLF